LDHYKPASPLSGVLFDENGGPVDYRFIEANAQLERQTGLNYIFATRCIALFPRRDHFGRDPISAVHVADQHAVTDENIGERAHRFRVISRNGFALEHQCELAVADVER
jgi:hypothetical protein